MTLAPLENTISRPLDSYLDGWWVLESQERCRPHFTYKVVAVQVFTGDPIDIEYHRGPFPTQAQAEEHALWDDVPIYWEANMAVYADHCLGCGRWAQVLAGFNRGGWAWRVTECSKCGILDSRVTCFKGECS